MSSLSTEFSPVGFHMVSRWHPGGIQVVPRWSRWYPGARQEIRAHCLAPFPCCPTPSWVRKAALWWSSAENLRATHWLLSVEECGLTRQMHGSLFSPWLTVGATRRSTGSRYLGPAPSSTLLPPQGGGNLSCIEDSLSLPACPLQNSDPRTVKPDIFLLCRGPSQCASSPGGPAGWRHHLASKSRPDQHPPRPPHVVPLVEPALWRRAPWSDGSTQCRKTSIWSRRKTCNPQSHPMADARNLNLSDCHGAALALDWGKQSHLLRAHLGSEVRQEPGWTPPPPLSSLAAQRWSPPGRCSNSECFPARKKCPGSRDDHVADQQTARRWMRRSLHWIPSTPRYCCQGCRSSSAFPAAAVPFSPLQHCPLRQRCRRRPLRQSCSSSQHWPDGPTSSWRGQGSPLQTPQPHRCPRKEVAAYDRGTGREMVVSSLPGRAPAGSWSLT